MKETYYYTELIHMGLTKTLIEKFFDPPDSTVPNPQNSRWADMKLYKRDRVESIIHKREFLEEFGKIDDRRVRRKAAQAN
jgi:hypothetical protein